MTNILILYYSKRGHVESLAHTIAQGVNRYHNANSIVARIADIPAKQADEDSHNNTELVASPELLNDCDGIILGCPSWFGGQPAAVKYFWDKTTPQWLNGTLVDKPAAVFCSSNSMHGGHETVLLNAMVPLLHHGMLMVGNAYTEQALNLTRKGGTPYGAGHVESANQPDKSGKVLDQQESLLALSLGERVARIADNLKNCPN